jgi:hypothetical protein
MPVEHPQVGEHALPCPIRARRRDRRHGPGSDHRTAEVLVTVEQSTAPREASRETQALIAEIHALRRKFNAAVERRDQAAGRVDALEAERKAQRWLNAAHPPQWYRRQIAHEQRKLTSAKTDITLLGVQHDEMMERLKQAQMRDAVARIEAMKASLQAPWTPPVGRPRS